MILIIFFIIIIIILVRIYLLLRYYNNYLITMNLNFCHIHDYPFDTKIYKLKKDNDDDFILNGLSELNDHLFKNKREKNNDLLIFDDNDSPVYSNKNIINLAFSDENVLYFRIVIYKNILLIKKTYSSILTIVELYDKNKLEKKLAYNLKFDSSFNIKCFDKYIIYYSSKNIYYLDYENDYDNDKISYQSNSLICVKDIVLIKVFGNLIFVLFEGNVMVINDLLRHEVISYFILYEYDKMKHVLCIDYKYIYLCEKQIKGNKIFSLKYPLVLFNYNINALKDMNFKFVY